MIGIIVSGHGHFATGILSALELISGNQNNMRAVDFEEGMSAEDLGKKIDSALSSFDEVEAVVLFTDLKGGTPFNQGFLRCHNSERFAVVAGVNLGMLLVSSFNQMNQSLEEFLDIAQQEGTAAIDYCTSSSVKQLDDEDE